MEFLVQHVASNSRVFGLALGRTDTEVSLATAA
jgi:hypothetical protein